MISLGVFMNINDKKYPNIADAVAFRIAFHSVACSYGDVGFYDVEREICSRCGLTEQYTDFIAPKSAFKQQYVILDTFHYAVSVDIKELLIDNFDITEDDFRPVRNKKGDIVSFQITPTHTMLPIESVNRIRQLKPCKKCGAVQYREKVYMNKDGYPYSFISHEGLEDLHDLNVTFEHFDMYLPKWVVSRRVYDFLVAKYPRMNFEPIFLK